MDIDKNKCVGCGNCHIICTMGVISLDEDGKSVVNQDECVECATCHRVLRNERIPPLVCPRHPEGSVAFQTGISGRCGRLPDRGAHAARTRLAAGLCGPSSATPPSFIRGPASPAGGPTRSRATMSPGGSGRARSGLVVEIGRPGTGRLFPGHRKGGDGACPARPGFRAGESRDPSDCRHEDRPDERGGPGRKGPLRHHRNQDRHGEDPRVSGRAGEGSA